jgi:hypothetical protein
MYLLLIFSQVGNGIIDEYTQAPYYPEFATNNTYGIRAVNDTVYNYMKFATYMTYGCLYQIDLCRATNRTTLSDQAVCTEAENMCRDNVEGSLDLSKSRSNYHLELIFRHRSLLLLWWKGCLRYSSSSRRSNSTG